MTRPGFVDQMMRFFTANPGTKIISVIIAFVLWVIVLGSRNVDVSKEIPLEIITASDIIPGNEIPEKITFKLSGPKAFLRQVLDRREEPIRVNLSGAKTGLVTYRFFADNIRLPIGVKVMSITPAMILVKLEPLKKREVPVRVELRGYPPEGYRVAKTEVKPRIVKIKGAESKVDGVTEVRTNPIDVSESRGTIEREASLDLARQGVQLEGALPQVSVEIEPTSANYRIKNVDVRVLSSHNVRLKEKTVSVMVRVDQNDLKLLDRSRVFAVVDLKGRPKGKYVEKVKVTLPENVGLVKVIPERVTVTLH